MELGGIYFFANSLMNVASWFIVAALYSHFPEATTGLTLAADTSASRANFSSGFVNATFANTTADSAGATLAAALTVACDAALQPLQSVLLLTPQRRWQHAT